MRITIDARMIRPGSMHGIARYVYQLIQCLKQGYSHIKFFILISQDSPLDSESFPSSMKLIKCKSQWISFREQWELPRVLRELKSDLFHAPSFVAPIFCPCKLVMTIHDLNHIVLPHYYTPLHQFYYHFFVQSCIRRSEYILTVSHFSKQEISRTLNVDGDKVFVTYNGVSDHYRPKSDPQYLRYIRDIYELPEKFIFCLSNNKPHKNVHQLVRAYCYSDVTVPLVLACPVDSRLIRIAEQYGKKYLLYFTKFIDEEHLPYIYSMTDLFVYPSTYEGFGLPPLEALSCGTPVVVANSSSLPEVVGSHAVFADPYDYRDIAAKLKSALYDSKVRQNVVDSGVDHARNFSWKKMTEQTVEVYDRCWKQAPKQVVGGVTNT